MYRYVYYIRLLKYSNDFLLLNNNVSFKIDLGIQINKRNEINTNTMAVTRGNGKLSSVWYVHLAFGRVPGCTRVRKARVIKGKVR